MDRRGECRLIEDLPVRVWTIDERGRWVAHFALARNVSRGGALLVGLEQELRCGDLLIVEHSEFKARFRIVWTRNSEGPHRIQAAVQRLEEDPCPWEAVLVEHELGQLP